MYAFYIHCPLIPLLILFLLPIYLHHASLHYPAITRTTTAALLVYHHILLLLLHHSPITNWLLAGATYVIAMRLLTCMQLPHNHNPLYTNHSQLQPVPFLSHFIYLFTATTTPPHIQPSLASLPPAADWVWTAGRLLVKVVLIHVAVHALVWLSGGQPSSHLLSYHSLPSTARTLLLCSLMSLLMYCTLSAVSITTTTAFSTLCTTPLPPLFHTPYLATSPRSFWSLRWNTMFTKLYTSLLFHPLAAVLLAMGTGSGSSSSGGGGKKKMAPLLSALAVFLLSGVLHCHQSMAAFHLVDGTTFVFFILQFVLCTAQVIARYKDSDRKNKRLIERGWSAVVERGVLGNVENGVTLLLLITTTRWFWPPYLDGGFIEQLQSFLLV